MNANQLVPAHRLALRYGVKMITYGPPGGGKTPAMKTAPRPVVLVTEPGMMTMRDSNLPCWLATTFAQIEEFFTWIFTSREARNFDTVCIDSGSQAAEIVLAHMMRTHSHGMKAYGEMSDKCCEWFDGLFYLQEKHVYIICKETTQVTVSTSFSPAGVPLITESTLVKPFFPGKDLPMKVSHKYDEILRAMRGDIPGVAGRHAHFRCAESATITARDRSGMLAEYEPLDLTALFKKIGY